jgi:hypothetical protein
VRMLRSRARSQVPGMSVVSESPHGRRFGTRCRTPPHAVAARLWAVCTPTEPIRWHCLSSS